MSSHDCCRDVRVPRLGGENARSRPSDEPNNVDAVEAGEWVVSGGEGRGGRRSAFWSRSGTARVRGR